MGKDREAGGRTVSGTFPMPVELPQLGEGPGSLERLAAVWHAKLPPIFKLAMIYIADGGNAIEDLPQFLNCGPNLAAGLLQSLKRGGWIR